MKPSVTIVWFRRDLRLTDNSALYYALKSGFAVVPLFIFDKNILDDLEEKADRRLQFIFDAITGMQAALQKQHSTLEVYYNTPLAAFTALLEKYTITEVYANEDYEQYALDRDNAIQNLLQKNGSRLKLYKDHVIFSKNEVLKKDGTPYSIFTPYSRLWKATLTGFYLKPYPTEKYFDNFYKQEPKQIFSLQSMGFKETNHNFPSVEIDEGLLKDYKKNRDFPSVENGTSRMGIHLRFGTISIRKLVAAAQKLSEVYLNELIWREFYMMVLWHSPRVRNEQSYYPAYDRIEWLNNHEEFEIWCNGNTGYPIVDAGMRQLNATGFMHNRVRMITASFLSKHLLIDWRWGEAYFAKKLLDYDFAANNGGWQWSAGTGCDAAPYFRVFNPTLQTQRFDKDLVYIKRWVPEFQEFTYQPMVEHNMARQRAIEVYKKALQQ